MFSLNKPGRCVQRSAPVVRAELSGSDTATALGIVAHGYTPILALCRKLRVSCAFRHPQTQIPLILAHRQPDQRTQFIDGKTRERT